MAIMSKQKQRWTADRIASLRERRGETLAAFANHFRLGEGSVRKWENGRGRPTGAATIVLDILEAIMDDEQPDLLELLSLDGAAAV